MAADAIEQKSTEEAVIKKVRDSSNGSLKVLIQ